MLGIIDLFMASTSRVTKEEKLSAEKFFKYRLERKGELTWICFLPRRTTLDIAQKFNLLPREGNIIAYEIPLNLIAGNPNLTRKAFFSLIEDFELVYNKELIGKKLAFLGISVGSMPALFLANRYDSQKVRVICSTARLGEGIFHAFAARKIKKEAIKSGFDEASYDSVLGEINPIENASNLPEDTKIVISRFDNYVPYKGGLELVKKLEKVRKGVRVYKIYMAGHFLTILLIGWWNKRHNFLN